MDFEDPARRCSILNMPLDTGFLVYMDAKRDRYRWNPLFSIDSLQGLKVEYCATVAYYILDTEYSYISDEWRCSLAEGVDGGLPRGPEATGMSPGHSTFVSSRGIMGSSARI